MDRLKDYEGFAIISAHPGFAHVHLATQCMSISDLEGVCVLSDAKDWLHILPIVAWDIYRTNNGGACCPTAITPVGRPEYEGRNAILCPDGCAIDDLGGEIYPSLEEFVVDACQQILGWFEEMAGEEGLSIYEWEAKAEKELEKKYSKPRPSRKREAA